MSLSDLFVFDEGLPCPSSLNSPVEPHRLPGGGLFDDAEEHGPLEGRPANPAVLNGSRDGFSLVGFVWLDFLDSVLEGFGEIYGWHEQLSKDLASRENEVFVHIQLFSAQTEAVATFERARGGKIDKAYLLEAEEYGGAA